MTDTIAQGAAFKGGRDLVAKRYSAERRFKFYGIAAITVTALFLLFLVIDIVIKGLPAFSEHSVKLDVKVDAAAVDPANIAAADFQKLVREALREKFPQVTDRAGRKQISKLLSEGAGEYLRSAVTANPKLIGTTVPVPALMSGDADLYLKGFQTETALKQGEGALEIAANGDAFTLKTAAQLAAGDIVRANGGALKVGAAESGGYAATVIEAPQSGGAAAAGSWDVISLSRAEADRRSSDREILWMESLRKDSAVSRGFSWRFFTSGDSRAPELAGIRGALIGSLLVIAVTLSICLPILRSLLRRTGSPTLSK
jgi:phosphate transport system permease protein